MTDIGYMVRRFVQRWRYRWDRNRMLLPGALRVLCDSHTRDEHRMGFTVEASPRWHPYGPYSQEQYIAAWRIVRRSIHRDTEPLL